MSICFLTGIAALPGYDRLCTQNVYILVVFDPYNWILEENELNNVGSSGPYTIACDGSTTTSQLCKSCYHIFNIVSTTNYRVGKVK